MPILIVVFGVILIYALVRVGWLGLRHVVSATCRRLHGRVPAAMAKWVDRQAAWSFREAWRAMWSSPEERR